MRKLGGIVLLLALVLAGIQPATASSTPSQVGLVSFTASGYNLDTFQTSLTIDWPGATNAKTYEIFMSRSYDMSSAKKYTSTSSVRQITGLSRGIDYFFQVRGVNGSHVGTKSNRVGHTTIYRQGPNTGPVFRVMTYNVCSRVCSGWSTRQSAALGRITAYQPDIVAAQEANYLPAPSGFSQALYWSGKRLFYLSSRFDPVIGPGDGALPPKTSQGCSPTHSEKDRTGYILLGFHDNGCRYAVWTELIDKATRQHTIFATVHTVAGDTLTRSQERRTETLALLAAMQSINAAGLPVVYAGDFNSHKNRAYDYVADAFHGAGYYDAYDLARNLRRQHMNSFNDFQITPKISYKWGDHIDHVWVAPRKTRVDYWRNGALIVDEKMVTPIPSDHSPLVIDLQVN